MAEDKQEKTDYPDFSEAVANLKRFSDQFKGIFKLAEYLKDVPSIQQAAEESLARLNKLRNEETTITSNIAAAKLEAETIVEQAKIDAAKIHQEADQYKQGVENGLLDKNKELIRLNAELEQTIKKRDEVRNQIDQIRKSL